MKITAKQAVERALAAAHDSIPYQYHLGAGGFKPEADTPNPSSPFCDCSGFISWTLGISREQPKTLGWIETTLVAKDAQGPHVLFQRVTQAQPGDVVVYGDADGHQGHIGLVTETENGKATRVAHCCARSGLESAIIDEPASVFWTGAIAGRGAIYARFKGFVEEMELKMDLKPVMVVKDGVTYKGALDEAAGITYLEIRALIPKGDFKWDKDKTKLTVKTN